MPLADFSSRVTRIIRCLGLILCLFKSDIHLRDRFLFKFILLRHMYVGYTNSSFFKRLSSNPFSCTFIHFTIVVLNWYDFRSYYIVLPTSISARGFHTLIICFRCIIYFTTYITHKVFGIIELWTYFTYFTVCSITGFYSFCLWLISNRVTVHMWIGIL